MKLVLAILLAFVAVTWARHGGHGKKGKHGLKHFNMVGLSKNFRKFQLPEGAVCSAEVVSCMKNVHSHARKCFSIRTGTMATKVRDCRKDNEEVKSSDKAWQEASFKWHKGLQDCVNEEPVPSTAGDPLFETDEFFFRRKREVAEASSQGSEEDCDGGHGEYTSFRECWAAMKTHHENCKAKVPTECPILARCDGHGPVPEDEDQAGWYNYMKAVREDKEAKMRTYRTNLFLCMDMDGINVDDLD